MHHPDPAEDPSGARKMATQRRGVGTAPAGSVSAEDYQASLQTSAGSSSPGPHHTLNLPPQSGAQVKKKSGFQITSVTPAQLSVSTNNSIAEDTESYDDLDESHTEDLSSSEIMDVSLSRANDAGGAERSSSEETLNNFHEAETPGATSPNQPSHPLSQAPHHGSMVNGTGPHHHNHLPHHHHHHHPHHHHSNNARPFTPGPAAVAQKMPSNMVVAQENISKTVPASVQSQPAGVAAPGSGPMMPSLAASVSVLGSPTSSVGPASTSAKVPVSSSAGAAAGSFMTTSNVAISQQHPNIPASVAMTTTTTASVNNSGVSRGSQGKPGSSVSAAVTAAPTAAGRPAAAATAASTTTAATSSRFRVVKLDSSSEPFKKGRWTCTDFHDKEPPVSASSSAAGSEPALNGLRQIVSEAAGSERDSTSGSSVSSTISTLGHYMEGVEAGGAQEYLSPPHGLQTVLSAGFSMTSSPNQPHLLAQDLNHIKTNVAPPTPTNLQSGHQTTMAPLTTAPQQLTYAQAVASPTPGSMQGMMGVQQHKMTYPSVPQQSSTLQAAPAQVRPSEYNHQLVSHPAAAQPPLNPPGSSGPSNGAAQMMMPGPAHVRTAAQQPAQIHPNSAGVPSQPTHLDCQQQKPQSFPTQITNPGVVAQNHQNHQSLVPATSVPLITAQNAGYSSRILPQGAAQAMTHAAQASALYASLPTFTTTQLQDAQRLLLQHQSALLGLPKLSGDPGSGSCPGQEADGNTSALTASAGLKSADGEDDGTSGASVVAIDNKIEQAMDLVKSHLMFAVREEVEVLKEQIKELLERNSQLEQENSLLKTLASPEQMAQFQAQVQTPQFQAQVQTPQFQAQVQTPPTVAPQNYSAPQTSHTSGSSA